MEQTAEEDQHEMLLGPETQHQSHQARRLRGRQKFHLETPEGISKDMSEFIVKEMIQMADDSEESGITDLEGSEMTVSLHSAPLPQSVDSAEELSKLRPRIDPRLFPSPG